MNPYLTAFCGILLGSRTLSIFGNANTKKGEKSDPPKKGEYQFEYVASFPAKCLCWGGFSPNLEKLEGEVN
jgi:hypothetical protein